LSLCKRLHFFRLSACMFLPPWSLLMTFDLILFSPPLGSYRDAGILSIWNSQGLALFICFFVLPLCARLNMEGLSHPLKHDPRLRVNLTSPEPLSRHGITVSS